MEQFLGKDWEIIPAGGATGEAFYAIYNEQRLFLKRNSSPFLAVLSAEGIVPKLVWTKRVESGDVITAQQWLNGRCLTHEEMQNERVIKLLKKIHSSEPLLILLKKIEKEAITPQKFLNESIQSLSKEWLDKKIVKEAISYLQKEVNRIPTNYKTVCHCDVNHNNWLLSDTNELYLIDWDGANIGDPAMDLGMLLYQYVPKKDWDDWLQVYGFEMTEELLLRMKWYTICQLISFISFYETKNNEKEVEKDLLLIEQILLQD